MYVIICKSNVNLVFDYKQLKLRLCPLNFGRYLETVIRGPVGKQDVPDESKVQDPIAVWQASPIKKIIVYCAQTITALRIIYANDTTGVTIGNADNGLEREIVMEEGEFIVSVSGRATANSHVDAIQFGTNLGRKTGWFVQLDCFFLTTFLLKYTGLVALVVSYSHVKITIRCCEVSVDLVQGNKLINYPLFLRIDQGQT